MESYFHFTSEITSLVTNPINLSFDYGMPIPGDSADVNANCMGDDNYGYDFYKEDNNPADKNGHGTHVAGTILSAADNVGHPIRIVPLQFGDMNENDEFKGSLFAAICAINYAVDREVDIINMSWGYSSPDRNQVLMHQVEKAHAAGILMVASLMIATLIMFCHLHACLIKRTCN